MPDESLAVLYQDERYVAIDKPHGLLVHRSPIDKRETRFAVQMLNEQLGRTVYLIHRLDRPTSGVLLFAFDPEAHRLMSKAFQERTVNKTYLAMVRGHAPESGVIDRPLRRFLDLDATHKSVEAQDARTEFTRLSKATLPYPTDKYETTRLSLLRLNPETGRRHQLRRHLAHLGYPIVGDSRYGDTRFNLAFRQNIGVEGLLLAAVELAFTHPFTQHQVRIAAPLDERWNVALRAFDDAISTPSIFD